MSSKGSQPTPDTPVPELDKEVVRLPDGRELTYYRFPEAPPRFSDATRPSPAKER